MKYKGFKVRLEQSDGVWLAIAYKQEEKQAWVGTALWQGTSLTVTVTLTVQDFEDKKIATKAIKKLIDEHTP